MKNRLLLLLFFSLLTFQVKAQYDKIRIEIDFSGKENRKIRNKESKKKEITDPYYYCYRPVTKDVWYRLWFIVEQDTFYAPHFSGYLKSRFHYVPCKVTEAYRDNKEMTLIIETTKKLYFIENFQELNWLRYNHRICYMGYIVIYEGGGRLVNAPIGFLSHDNLVRKKSKINYDKRKSAVCWGLFNKENASPKCLYKPIPLIKPKNWQPFNAINIEDENTYSPQIIPCDSVEKTR